MTVVAVEPFVVGLSVLLVVLLSSVIALRPFVVVRSSVLARPSLVSRPSIKLVRTVVRSIVRPSHFAARSISSRSTADRRSLSSLELVALVDGLVSLSGNRLDSSFLFLVLLVVQVFSTLGLSVDVSFWSPPRGDFSRPPPEDCEPLSSSSMASSDPPLPSAQSGTPSSGPAYDRLIDTLKRAALDLEGEIDQLRSRREALMVSSNHPAIFSDSPLTSVESTPSVLGSGLSDPSVVQRNDDPPSHDENPPSPSPSKNPSNDPSSSRANRTSIDEPLIPPLRLTRRSYAEQGLVPLPPTDLTSRRTRRRPTTPPPSYEPPVAVSTIQNPSTTAPTALTTVSLSAPVVMSQPAAAPSAEFSSLPLSREHGTPQWDPAASRTSVSRYFRELERLLVQKNVTVDQERKQAAVMYTPSDVERNWSSLPQFNDAAVTFDDFKKAVLEFYPGLDSNQRWTVAEFNAC